MAFETDSIAIWHVWFNPRDSESHVDISGMDHSISLHSCSHTTQMT